jgi:hypothetical protein
MGYIYLFILIIVISNFFYFNSKYNFVKLIVNVLDLKGIAWVNLRGGELGMQGKTIISFFLPNNMQF